MNEKLLALGLGGSRFVTASGMWMFVRPRAEEMVGCVGVQGMMIRQRVGLLDVGPRDTAQVSDGVPSFARS